MNQVGITTDGRPVVSGFFPLFGAGRTGREGHAAQGRSSVSGRTEHANLNCCWTVNSRCRVVFGLGVLTKSRR
jgi:hypothetical protein